MRQDRKSVMLAEIRVAVLQTGYTQENLDQTLDAYERLGVWQLNPSRTKITFLDVDG
jgi:DNA replication licensing factor MCM7